MLCPPGSIVLGIPPAWVPSIGAQLSRRQTIPGLWKSRSRMVPAALDSETLNLAKDGAVVVIQRETLDGFSFSGGLPGAPTRS
jgi:hypothetical protein